MTPYLCNIGDHFDLSISNAFLVNELWTFVEVVTNRLYHYIRFGESAKFQLQISST